MPVLKQRGRMIDPEDYVEKEAGGIAFYVLNRDDSALIPVLHSTPH